MTAKRLYFFGIRLIIHMKRTLDLISIIIVIALDGDHCVSYCLLSILSLKCSFHCSTLETCDWWSSLNLIPGILTYDHHRYRPPDKTWWISVDPKIAGCDDRKTFVFLRHSANYYLKSFFPYTMFLVALLAIRLLFAGTPPCDYQVVTECKLLYSLKSTSHFA